MLINILLTKPTLNYKFFFLYFKLKNLPLQYSQVRFYLWLLGSDSPLTKASVSTKLFQFCWVTKKFQMVTHTTDHFFQQLLYILEF